MSSRNRAVWQTDDYVEANYDPSDDTIGSTKLPVSQEIKDLVSRAGTGARKLQEEQSRRD